MRILSCVMLICVTSPLMAAEGVDEKKSSAELKPLLGKWIAVSVNGKSLPPGKKPTDPLRDVDGLVTPYVGQYIGQIVTISSKDQGSPYLQSVTLEHDRIVRTVVVKKFDATISPNEIDLMVYDFLGKATPQLQQVTMKGIYMLKDGKLTWCLASPGNPRPKTLANRKESGHMLVTFAR